MITHKSTILAQSVRATARRRASAPTAGQWLGAALFGVCAVAAFGLVANTAPQMVPVELIKIDLPQPAVAVVAAEAAGYWREDRVRRGDTIGSVLARLGVDDPAALEFLRTNPSARPLYQLRPGKPLTVETDDDGRLVNLRFVTGDGQRLSIGRDGDRLTAQSAAAPVEIRWKIATGEIQSSLFAAADAAGLPDAVTLQLADVFSGDIDFYHDLRRGDRFTVVYEMRYIDGEPVGAGRIVAAEFENRGRTIRGFLWRGDDGAENYYAAGRRADEEGLPALADGVLPRDLGLFECALPPDPADLARAQGRRLRRALRHAGARHRQRQGDVRRQAERLWQRDSAAASAARSPRSMRICRDSRRRCARAHAWRRAR